MWQERNERGIEGEPPCETCRVVLWPENKKTAEVYLQTRRQVIMMHNGEHDIVYDLSIPAVKIVMDLNGVGAQRECLQTVMRVFHHFEKERRKG